ncbi:MAG: lipid-binding SYLF domain-containing protein [Nitrospira sp.]|nr:lipid-binding SYLF domain-containing protein [Nitrospira sp.]
MRLISFFILTLALLFGPAIGPTIARASDESELKELVERSNKTLENFLADSNMAWFRDHMKEAKGVFIVPRMWKGAFFFGGEGGTGVFLAKNATDEWSDPAFYTMGTASVGFQFGVQASEIILLAMTQRGIESMLSNTFKLGADVSIAAGPVGAGVEGGTAALSADLVTFARAKGLFGGISLEGAVIAVRDESNRHYYGKDVRPLDILMMRTVSNPESAGLRATLARAAEGKSPSRTDAPASN